MKYRSSFNFYFSNKTVDEIDNSLITKRILEQQKLLGNDYKSHQIKIGEFGSSQAHPKGAIVIGDWDLKV